MANIPVNSKAIYVSPGETISGRFNGLYIDPNTIITKLTDVNKVLISPSKPLIVPAPGGYVPLFVTNVTIDAESTGGVMLFT
jgi:hypothetical protein